MPDRIAPNSAAVISLRAAAVLHIMNMPDAEERRRYQLELSEELAQFERPKPVMDEYDLLLRRKGVIQ